MHASLQTANKREAASSVVVHSLNFSMRKQAFVLVCTSLLEEWFVPSLERRIFPTAARMRLFTAMILPLVQDALYFTSSIFIFRFALFQTGVKNETINHLNVEFNRPASLSDSFGKNIILKLTFMFPMLQNE